MMLSTILLGVGLSMDCIAVILSLHASDQRKKSIIHVIPPVVFAVFHTFMPFVGWFLGIGFKQIVTQYDHWLAFILLTVVGANMIRSSFAPSKKEGVPKYLTFKSMILLALATSIDAIVIGMTIALLNQNIVYSASIIGITTLVLSLAADIIGDYIGPLFKNSRQGILGGVVIIGIGVKILIEHMVA